MTIQEKANKLLSQIKIKDSDSNYKYIKNIVLSEDMGNFSDFFIKADRGGSSYWHYAFLPVFESDRLIESDYPVLIQSVEKYKYENVKMIVALTNDIYDFLQCRVYCKNKDNRNVIQKSFRFFYDTSMLGELERNLPPNQETYTVFNWGMSVNIWEHGSSSPANDSVTINFANSYDNLSTLSCFYVYYDENNGLNEVDISNIINNYDTIEDLKRNVQLFSKFKANCFNYTDSSEDDFLDKLGTEYTMLNITHQTDALQSTDSIINQVNFKMVVPQGKRISGYVTNDVPYNIKLQTDAETIYYYANRYSETYEILYELPNINMTFPDFITDGQGNFYYSIMSTNIPIFKSKQDSDMYQNGQKDKEDSLNGGGAYSPPKNKTGEDIDEMDVDSYDDGVFISNSGGFSTTHILTHSQVQTVFTNLYDENVVGWDALIKGLELYGTRPIESIIDLYYIPFALRKQD